MTVREWLVANGTQLKEVQVIDEKWGCSIVDHRKPESSYMDVKVEKVRHTARGTVLYVR